MIVGHIILGHKNPEQIMDLARAIRSEKSLVVIHLDRKTDFKPYRELKNLSNVHIVKKRVSVNWGGFSQITAVINSMKFLLEKCPEVEYVNLLSGQDYPIREVSSFHQYLANNPKGAFMEFLDQDDLWTIKAAERFNRYHLSDYEFFGKYQVEKLIDLVFPIRSFPANFKLVGKSQWFTIDKESAMYVLNTFKNNKKLIRCFKFSWGADELFFQSLIYNSPLKSKLINNNLRYIDWSENKSSPKILRLEDGNKLAESKCFFARKFDRHIDKSILDYIDEELL